MADEVEMIPVAGAEPPKVNPLVNKLPKPGLKLPTQSALKPGLRLPPKPVIRKPGAAVAPMSLPKPITPVVGGPSKTMETLKSVTQKLKGITQEIPQQAVLHKTGIIAESGISEGQKEAAKHKTARISLSDAMGVAPVRDEAAPMKTIRIKRPVNIPTPTPTTSLAPQPKADEKPAAADSAAPNMTQRKTLKITRPDGIAVRPSGKFGIKRPGQPAAPASESAPAEDSVEDISDIPNVPAAPAPIAANPATEVGPAWLWTLSAIVQLAACVVIGALAWFLYENTQMQYF